MKKKLFITLSAITALFFVFNARQVFSWGLDIQTGHDQNGWYSFTSGEQNISGTGYAKLTAPYASTTNCGTRYGELWRHGDGAPFSTLQCPTNTNFAPECCVRQTVSNMDLALRSIYVNQTASGDLACGPTCLVFGPTNQNCTPN